MTFILSYSLEMAFIVHTFFFREFSTHFKILSIQLLLVINLKHLKFHAQSHCDLSKIIDFNCLILIKVSNFI